uniref:Uncharacterized protein n=1 Tax=Quercus lobata TaxID=97700 RepID=A0A7N2L4P5_QUELO
MRKKTAKKCVTFIIWSAYLLADWAASFAVGLIFDTEEKYASAQDKGDDAKGAEADTGLLLVLWFIKTDYGSQHFSCCLLEPSSMLRGSLRCILQVRTALEHPYLKIRIQGPTMRN